MTDADPPADADIRVRDIDGVRCTTRAGIAALAGWPPGNTVHVRAATDPDFPDPISGKRIGRDYWYPLDGPHGVHNYLDLLDHRRQAKKPPPAAAADPARLYPPAEAAEIIGVDPATFRSYVRNSVQLWDQGERAILPPPDDVEVQGRRVLRRWRGDTLTNHQATRPGPGTGAGRPRRRGPDDTAKP